MITSRRDGGRGIEIEPTGGVVDWGDGFGVDCCISPASKNKSPKSIPINFIFITNY